MEIVNLSRRELEDHKTASRRENVDTCFVGVTKHPVDLAHTLKVQSIIVGKGGLCHSQRAEMVNVAAQLPFSFHLAWDPST